MSERLKQYNELVDALREQRRESGWRPENDRDLLVQLEDAHLKLCVHERVVVEAEGWRSWPEEFDRRANEVRYSYLISWDESAQVYAGHCLQLDLVSQGTTEELALAAIKEAVQLFLKRWPPRRSEG